ncbi:hypothetical protein B566_EDAN002177 [Ephemera danica]|nr:hypothetical protein B566_EDAN002177 [Ephemera danica]
MLKCSQAPPKPPVSPTRDELALAAERKRREDLAYKRSFFVRMVSDPKIYNPKIAKSLGHVGSRRHVSAGEEETVNEMPAEEDAAAAENGVTIQRPIASWISWPMQFLFQGVFDDMASSQMPVSQMPVRFRHLDTMVRLKPNNNTGGSSASGGSSPESEGSGGSGAPKTRVGFGGRGFPCLLVYNFEHRPCSSHCECKNSFRMNSQEFGEHGKAMVDYICQYLDTLGSRRVTPDVQPGYLRKLLPNQAPQKPEAWENIMADVDNKIMPGITHWQHPRFHAYFPSGNSFPSILGDMLSDAIGCIGFSWAASPACTELETISSASECILVAMLAARAQAINRLKQDDPDMEDGICLTKLVAYCSKEAHSCVEKAAMISLVKLRILEADENCSLRGETVEEAMQKDREQGLVPFFVSCTLGTTSSCAFDNVAEIGPICSKFDVWMHMDGAYAGNAFICPEFQHLHKGGSPFASSFNTNPNKWLLTNFDISCLWVRDRYKLTSAMIVDPIYLKHAHDDEAIDYRHWGIPLSRRFRALKLWFVMRSYGLEGLQNYIREHCRLAKKFESLARKDDRFEIMNDVQMGLVCIRLHGSDTLTQDLLARINTSGKLHMIPSVVRGKYIIRFCVVAEHSTDADIEHAWEVIGEYATKVLDAVKQPQTPKERIVEENNRHKRLSQRFSFTRSVSRDVFQRSQSRTSLYDGVSPIIILDENQQECGADVFTFSIIEEAPKVDNRTVL